MYTFYQGFFSDMMNEGPRLVRLAGFKQTVYIMYGHYNAGNA
jgi:hypothetical protein